MSMDRDDKEFWNFLNNNSDDPIVVYYSIDASALMKEHLSQPLRLRFIVGNLGQIQIKVVNGEDKTSVNVLADTEELENLLAKIKEAAEQDLECLNQNHDEEYEDEDEDTE